jgi:hypothetical protein
MRWLELAQDDGMDIGLTSSSKTSSQEENFDKNKTPIAGKFFYEDLKDLHLQFSPMIPRVKERILSQAEMLLEKMPVTTTNNEIEKISFILQRLLTEEIFYEKEHYEEAGFVIEQIETMIKDNNMILSSKEKECFYDNLSKLYLANGQIMPEKMSLSELIIINPKNEEFQRRHMSCQQEMIFWYGSEFNGQDVDAQYKIGVVQYNKAVDSNDCKLMDLSDNNPIESSDNKYYENAKMHFLKADPYNAYVNYYLGKIVAYYLGKIEIGKIEYLDKIEELNCYFKKALKVALFDNLEFSFCLDIAEHFLKNEEKESIFIELVMLFSNDIFAESDPEKRREILERLSEKIKDEEIIQFARSTSQNLFAKLNCLSPRDPSEDDRQRHLEGLGEVEKFGSSMGKGDKFPESLIQKLFALSLENELAGESQEQFLEIEESATVTTSAHSHLEKFEMGIVENLKQPARLIDEDEIIANYKTMLFKVKNGLQKKESKAQRAGTLKTAKIILHTLRHIFPDELEILLLLGKIYLEEQNLSKAAICFKMCMYNFESLDQNGTPLFGLSREEIFLDASYLYNFVIPNSENINSNLWDNVPYDLKKDL